MDFTADTYIPNELPKPAIVHQYEGDLSRFEIDDNCGCDLNIDSGECVVCVNDYVSNEKDLNDKIEDLNDCLDDIGECLTEPYRKKREQDEKLSAFSNDITMVDTPPEK